LPRGDEPVIQTTEPLKIRSHTGKRAEDKLSGVKTKTYTGPEITNEKKKHKRKFWGYQPREEGTANREAER